MNRNDDDNEDVTDKMRTDEAMAWYAGLNPIEQAEVDELIKELVKIEKLGRVSAIEVIYRVKQLIVREAIKAL